MYIEFPQTEVVFSLELGKDQAGICAAKAEAVSQGDVDFLFLGRVWYKIEVGADI